MTLLVDNPVAIMPPIPGIISPEYAY
jgi:hypothetical protein